MVEEEGDAGAPLEVVHSLVIDGALMDVMPCMEGEVSACCG